MRNINIPYTYLLKPGTSQKEQEPFETSRNQLKRPTKIAKRLKMTLNFKSGEI